jgi:hypothetical protein
MKTYPILQRLRDRRVFSATFALDDQHFYLTEACDDYFYERLTPVELLKLSNELMDLALNAIQPEG